VIGDILQPTHLLFVLVIALLVLGPKRLPEVGRSLGRGLRDFKNALSGDEPDHHGQVLSQTTVEGPPPVVERATPGADQATPVADQATPVADPATPVAERAERVG
jgi:sec-independent protein translocase protein TatA